MIDTGCERRSPTMANRRGDPPILQLCLGLYSFVFGLACISIGLDWFVLLLGVTPMQCLSHAYWSHLCRLISVH